MAIALSVEQSRIGQRVDAVVTGHGGAVRRPFRDAGTATVQIICCHSIPLPFERCDAATSLHQVGVTTTTLHGLHIILMRSEEHTSELQSLMRISYAVFCLKKKNIHKSYRNNIL